MTRLPVPLCAVWQVDLAVETKMIGIRNAVRLARRNPEFWNGLPDIPTDQKTIRLNVSPDIHAFIEECCARYRVPRSRIIQSLLWMAGSDLANALYARDLDRYLPETAA